MPTWNIEAQHFGICLVVSTNNISRAHVVHSLAEVLGMRCSLHCTPCSLPHNFPNDTCSKVVREWALPYLSVLPRVVTTKKLDSSYFHTYGQNSTIVTMKNYAIEDITWCIAHIYWSDHSQPWQPCS